MRSDKRLDHLVRIPGTDHHRAGVIIEHVGVGRDFALPHHDAQRLPVGEAAVGEPRRQLRVIDENGSGADDDRIACPATAMHVGACGRTGDPLTAAVGRRAATVDTGGEFPCDMREPGALLVQPLAQGAAGDLVGQHACDHLHTRLGEPGRSARGGRIGVVHGVHNHRNASGDKGIDARRRSTVMVARLEGHHGRAARGASTRLPQRHHFSMRAAGRLGGTDADGLAVAIQDDCAHRRIGIGAALDRSACSTASRIAASKLIGADVWTRRRPACAAPRRRPPGPRRCRRRNPRRSSPHPLPRRPRSFRR